VRSIRTLVLAVVIAIAGAAAGADPVAATGTTTTSPTPATVWLCRPGLADNPCTPNLTTTRTSYAGVVSAVNRTQAAARPAIDCFYVYPTVSDQKTPNADLTVDPSQRSIALYQAALFSRVCHVYAPVYRQLTLANIAGNATPGQQALASGDVLQAWQTYLRQYNHGRGVVLIGHSQGSFILRRLIATQIDPRPAVRKLLVSAVLLGGNVTVKKGSDTGGDFHHIRACHSASQLACVIAFSTYGATPPADSVFGRTTAPGMQILCTNPAALGGGTGLVDPILPTRPFAPGSTIAAGISLLGFTTPAADTPWVSAPGAYSARCSSAGGANVLSISPRNGAPQLHPSPVPSWGLHLVDTNIALGNLVGIVSSEAAAYRSTH
jgi:hypothetical protein